LCAISCLPPCNYSQETALRYKRDQDGHKRSLKALEAQVRSLGKGRTAELGAHLLELHSEDQKLQQISAELMQRVKALEEDLDEEQKKASSLEETVKSLEVERDALTAAEAKQNEARLSALSMIETQTSKISDLEDALSSSESRVSTLQEAITTLTEQQIDEDIISDLTLREAQALDKYKSVQEELTSALGEKQSLEVALRTMKLDFDQVCDNSWPLYTFHTFVFMIPYLSLSLHLCFCFILLYILPA
jgi:chromosome segregation ATPase